MSVRGEWEKGHHDTQVLLVDRETTCQEDNKPKLLLYSVCISISVPIFLCHNIISRKRQSTKKRAVRVLLPRHQTTSLKLRIKKSFIHYLSN